MVFLRRMLGRPHDWNLRRPSPWTPQPGLHWLGPLVIIVSVVAAWFAFTGAQGEPGEGSPSFSMFMGSASILLMAWSFVLAVRIPFLELFFGGLDSMYRAHRWCGALAIVPMFLHTSNEPEVEGGILGASEDVADAAQDLAGLGETMIYILVVLSLLRWMPYRYWRWTHKLFGVPFAFASWHFYTAEKPYANGSAWGWYFVLFMTTGLVAYLVRVLGRDVFARGVKYRVAAFPRHGSVTELELAPTGKKLVHRAGQFAVVKIDEPGLREPHVFTIASSPDDPNLRFFIRDLGDWTARLQTTDLSDVNVVVEGPYGRFEPFGTGRAVWIAGGVGITPFLSATSSLPVAAEGARPVLIYCVRSRDDAMALTVLEAAAAEGRLDLDLFESSQGRRFSAAALHERFGPNGLAGAHVAVCGPVGLIATSRAAARSLGASEVETEDFDIRSGFGPDLSRDIEAARERVMG